MVSLKIYFFLVIILKMEFKKHYFYEIDRILKQNSKYLSLFILICSIFEDLG